MIAFFFYIYIVTIVSYSAFTIKQRIHISNTYWERDFNKWLEETYVNVDKSRSVVLREEYVNNALEYLV